jgi:hypothetical protein
MRMRRFHIILALMAGLAGSAAAQEPQVLASVTGTTIGMEETVTFTIEIRAETLSGVVTPSPPEAGGLALVQAFPNTQQSMSIVNGRVSQGVAYSWTYRPVREGRTSFPAVSVRVGDREYHTTPVDVEVVPQAQRPQRRAAPSRTDPFAGFRTPTDDAPAEALVPDENDLFIRVVPSTRSPFQNEQVLIQYELYFRDGIQLRSSRLTDSWDAEGFWREELDVDARPIPRVVVENGLRYNTITLKRAAVFPTRPGALEVDPLKIETEAQLPSRSRDPFAQFFSLRSQYRLVELSSPALTIGARALPPGAPASFRGAVGQFGMIVDLDRTEVPVGGSVQMTVTLTGAGNIATLASPEVHVPGAFERYDPQVETVIDRSGDRLQGSKRFRYVFVARSNGKYEFPVVSFSYLDPASGTYREVHSDPGTVRVTGSADDSPIARATSGGFPVDDIAGPWLEPAAWMRTDRTPLHRQAWPYAALLLPALLAGALVVADRRTRRLAANPALGRHRRAHPLARKHLRLAVELQEARKYRAFYEEVSRAILGFIGNRLDVAEHGLTRERLDDRLARSGVPPEIRRELRAFLDACDRARFGPLEPESGAVEVDRDRASRLLVLLDEALEAGRS